MKSMPGLSCFVTSSGGFDAHLQLMRKMGTPGTRAELFAFSSLTGTPLSTHIGSHSKWDMTTPPWVLDSEPVMYLFNSNGNHYDVVFDIAVGSHIDQGIQSLPSDTLYPQLQQVERWISNNKNMFCEDIISPEIMFFDEEKVEIFREQMESDASCAILRDATCFTFMNKDDMNKFFFITG